MSKEAQVHMSLMAILSIFRLPSAWPFPHSPFRIVRIKFHTLRLSLLSSRRHYHACSTAIVLLNYEVILRDGEQLSELVHGGFTNSHQLSGKRHIAAISCKNSAG